MFFSQQGKTGDSKHHVEINLHAAVICSDFFSTLYFSYQLSCFFPLFYFFVRLCAQQQTAMWVRKWSVLSHL